MTKDWTFNELKQKLETDILDENARKSILKIFANVIEKTHYLNPSNWNISFRNGGSGIRFQLNFGHRYVLGVYSDSILVMNKRETFLNLQRDFIAQILNECEFANDGTNKIPKPRTVEELENYPPEELWNNSIQFRIPFLKCENYLETLEPAICDFAKWCTENRKKNPQSEEAHVSAFIDYLNQELETNIPQPEYEGGWNPDIEEQLKLYKDFQTEFPVAKIRNLTLKEYNNTERKNAFCYWIETRLRKLGSIQGSTSYKFGIYEYNENPRDDNGYSFDGQYAWLSKYGKSSDEAYEKVRSNIINIIEAAQHADLDEIEKIDVSPMFKWKIAFLYSDFTLMNIFSREGLVYLANKYGLEFADKATLCELYQFLLSKKGIEEHILKYSARIWNEWVNSDECKSKKNNIQGDSQMTGYEEKLDEIKNNLLANKNVILTGAPGTGKTFMAKTVAERMGCTKNEICFVQFHPSYDYTDFVEGLRPKQVEGSDQIGFERKDGVFKAFCERALLSQTINNKDFLENLNKNPKIWKVSLCRTGENEIRKDCLENNYIRIGWSEYGNIENFDDFENFSNGGKSILRSYQNEMQIGDIVLSCFSAKEIDAIGIITGDYEYKREGNEYPRYRNVKWIVKNIRENITELNNGKSLTLSTIYKLSISLTDIKFIIEKYITGKSEEKEPTPFVFIIDEINRGEVAKIFGELFYCVDPGYRGEKGRISTQYQNLVTSGEFQKGFFIPENVYIIGTMNDIDRSVESMDFAFRRRFSWIEVKASDTVDMLDQKYDDNGELIAGLEKNLAEEAKRRMKNLNAEISKIEDLNDAYHIGASYFLKLKNYGGDFGKLWDYHIKGILQEYLRGNPKADEEITKLKAAYDKKEELKAGE